ncbi:hypothetical protein ABIE61_000315 [Marinobacterium sp. MBR-111]|jgi:hypothetical protein
MGMSESQVVITSPDSLRDRMMRVWELVNQAVRAGGSVAVTIGKPNKSRDQERKYHAMIGDIAKQVTFYGTKRHSAEVWKALLVEMFERERQAMGEPLRKPGRLVPSLDGERMVSLRPSTRDFSVQEGRDFIEFLYAQGVEMGVDWSEPALRVYEQYREVQS